MHGQSSAPPSAAQSELLPGLHEKNASAAQQLLRQLLVEEADRTFRPRRRHLFSANLRAFDSRNALWVAHERALAVAYVT